MPFGRTTLGLLLATFRGHRHVDFTVYKASYLPVRCRNLLEVGVLITSCPEVPRNGVAIRERREFTSTVQVCSTGFDCKGAASREIVRAHLTDSLGGPLVGWSTRWLVHSLAGPLVGRSSGRVRSSGRGRSSGHGPETKTTFRSRPRAFPNLLLVRVHVQQSWVSMFCQAASTAFSPSVISWARTPRGELRLTATGATIRIGRSCHQLPRPINVWDQNRFDDRSFYNGQRQPSRSTDSPPDDASAPLAAITVADQGCFRIAHKWPNVRK
jgi:hypothetical protein